MRRFEAEMNLDPQEGWMIVPCYRHDHPFVNAGAVLTVGEHHDRASVWRVGDDEVAERVVCAPMPEYVAVLVSLNAPPKPPREGAVEPHLRRKHRLAGCGGETQPLGRWLC